MIKTPVKFILYAEANHDGSNPAFTEPELLSWSFSQHK